MTILFLLLAACVSVPERMHAADSAVPGTDSYILFSTDRVLRGENASEDFFFEIGKGRKLSPGSYLDLNFGHSPTLIQKRSTLTVLMDDTPLGSVTLDDSNKDQSNLQIDISQLALAPGFHKLTFRTHLEMAINACTNPQNAANWLVVFANSRLNLNLSQSYGDADLTWYPSPYYEKGSISPLKAIFIVPDQIEQPEFVAAARLIQYFSSQTSPERRLDVPVYTESELTDAILHNNTAVWIGRPDRWKAQGQSTIAAVRSTMEAAGKEKGFIAVTAYRQNETSPAIPHLVISGNVDELANAATILTDETLYSQLRGKLSLIPTELIKKELEPDLVLNSPNTVSLEKMGYGNLIVERVSYGQTRFNYAIPNNWDMENAKLKLLYRHTKSIFNGQSTISVKVNGVPASSRRLTDSTADGGTLEVALDQAWIGTRRNLEVEVSFQFVENDEDRSATQTLQHTDDCGDYDFSAGWAVLDKASSLTFTPVERQMFNLQSLPYPLVGGSRWNPTLFIFPDHAAGKVLNVAMTAIGIAGRSALDGTGIQVATASAADLKDAAKNRNIVYIGASKDLPEFLNGYSASAVQFKGDTVTSRVKNVELLPELQTRSAIMQVTKSPLADNRGVLLLTADTAERLKSITDAWVSPMERDKISGKFIAIDLQNKLYTFPAAEDPVPVKKGKGKANTLRSFLQSADTGELNKSLFVIAFLAALLLILITYIIVRRRKS
jgi:hypothetical protein